MKSSTKELICAVLIFVVFGLIAAMSGCTPILHSKYSSGKITYEQMGVLREEELSAEEVETVVSILNGKTTSDHFHFLPVTCEPCCDISQTKTLRIGVTTYYLAVDGCPLLENSINGTHVSLSKEEWEILQTVFIAHRQASEEGVN